MLKIGYGYEAPHRYVFYVYLRFDLKENSVLPLTQNSIHGLRSADILQNGAIGWGDEFNKVVIFLFLCTQKVFS